MKLHSHSYETLIFKTREDLGFIPSQILYVEGDFCELPNQFIVNNFERITEACKTLNFRFVYLPKIYEAVVDQSVWKHFASYFYPSMRSKIKSMNLNDLPQYVLTLLSSMHKTIREYFDALDYQSEIRPGLLRLVAVSETEGYTFEYFIFDKSGNIELSTQMEHYLIRLYDSLADNQGKDADGKRTGDADKQKRALSFLFDAESEDLTTAMLKAKDSADMPQKNITRVFAMFITADEQKKHINKLIEGLKCEITNMNLGVLNSLIEKAIHELSNVIGVEINQDKQLSRLVMDSDYRIWLLDYKNIEIRMSHLQKSLYVLFLRHPEGIRLCCLSDYYVELLIIYVIISECDLFRDRNRILESILSLCSPVENSVNEKLAAIKKAFLKKISNAHAEFYYITGERGGLMKSRIASDPKSVSLSKKLNAELPPLRFPFTEEEREQYNLPINDILIKTPKQENEKE
jgi:hypothetical protein